MRNLLKLPSNWSPLLTQNEVTSVCYVEGACFIHALNFFATYFEFGSTHNGGLLLTSKIEEKYVILWRSLGEQIFELPIGGAAIMRVGTNLIYFAKKEQCLALEHQLKKRFKIGDCKIFRIFSNHVVFIHPSDGVASEKINLGRTAIGAVNYSIGKNREPVEDKWQQVWNKLS